MGKVSKLVLDAGPLINLTREEIVARGDQLYATPAVIREIKDEEARRRLDLMKHEISVVQPSAASVKFASEFAKLTGDGLVLSTQDIEVIALAYELVDDKSRLRTYPQVNDANSVVVNEKNEQPQEKETPVDDDGFITVKSKAPKPKKPSAKSVTPALDKLSLSAAGSASGSSGSGSGSVSASTPGSGPATESASSAATSSAATSSAESAPSAAPKSASASTPGSASMPRSTSQPAKEDEDSDWSDDDWISPENVEEKMKTEATNAAPIDEDIEVAVASRDYAVQNTALQIGLCAVNERGLRIKQLKSYMQRCYACFKLIPLGDTPKQFCPQCGGHTLSRVSTSVDKHGRLHVHLKAKMQWITRGDRYNVPNPQSRRARRQQHDSKKEFYAEDQPEYVKAVKKQQWQQRRNARQVAEYVGPSTVDSAVSPFAPNREPTARVQIGRGRYANATGKKTEYSLR